MKKALVVCLLVLACVSAVFASDSLFLKIGISPYTLGLYKGERYTKYGFEAKIAAGYSHEKYSVGVEIKGLKTWNLETQNESAVSGSVFASYTLNSVMFSPTLSLKAGIAHFVFRDKETHQKIKSDNSFTASLSVEGYYGSLSKVTGVGSDFDFYIRKDDEAWKYSAMIAPYVNTMFVYSPELYGVELLDDSYQILHGIIPYFGELGYSLCSPSRVSNVHIPSFKLLI